MHIELAMRIALVDPSRAVQKAMTEMIGQGEHDVLAFCEGRTALSRLSTDPDVRALLTSVQLPDISGIELCAAARKLAGSRRPLFIGVMSSTSDYSLAVQALDNGADDFIRKPPFAEELRARLRAADRLTLLQSQLIKLATTDSLTGLLNRRAFFDSAAAACAAAETSKSLSAIIFDVDNFKHVNDTHGHEAGDIVLAAVSKIVMTAGMTIAGRLGGEEFGVLEACALDDAIDHAEELRRSISNLRFSEWNLAGVTCSFGVAEWEKGDTIDALLRRADMAMYHAKTSGRDRVVAADTYRHTPEHERWRGNIRTTKNRGN
jgi:two-component system, cell cycle response regulator